MQDDDDDDADDANDDRLHNSWKLSNLERSLVARTLEKDER